ncbi:MAG: hypothetical protein NZL83_00140 [Candidatus Absconditabacterales bacterium]|nr:hypothetical protein [Candidatus Absconditabacterales bacterium]
MHPAYLHEYFDEKFWSVDQIEERSAKLQELLTNNSISQTDQDHIIFIIKHVGYGKSLERGTDFPYTPEFQIVEDADRLDAIGAIGIARTFAYGGKKGRPLYDPDIAVRNLHNDKQYRKEKNTSLNHFYEKLLLLKDLMHTQTGKILAQPRHEYMQQFVTQFLNEWNE